MVRKHYSVVVSQQVLFGPKDEYRSGFPGKLKIQRNERRFCVL